MQRNISLVLGSGGARGLAHIGVIHWLEEHDFNIQSISGCSMGALIGGIHAAGKRLAKRKQQHIKTQQTKTQASLPEKSLRL